MKYHDPIEQKFTQQILGNGILPEQGPGGALMGSDHQSNNMTGKFAQDSVIL